MNSEHVFRPVFCMESKDFVRVIICVWFCNIAKDIYGKKSRSQNFHKFSQFSHFCENFQLSQKFKISVKLVNFAESTHFHTTLSNFARTFCEAQTEYFVPAPVPE